MGLSFNLTPSTQLKRVEFLGTILNWNKPQRFDSFDLPCPKCGERGWKSSSRERNAHRNWYVRCWLDHFRSMLLRQLFSVSFWSDDDSESSLVRLRRPEFNEKYIYLLRAGDAILLRLCWIIIVLTHGVWYTVVWKQTTAVKYSTAKVETRTPHHSYFCRTLPIVVHLYVIINQQS